MHPEPGAQLEFFSHKDLASLQQAVAPIPCPWAAAEGGGDLSEALEPQHAWPNTLPGLVRHSLSGGLAESSVTLTPVLRGQTETSISADNPGKHTMSR